MFIMIGISPFAVAAGLVALAIVVGIHITIGAIITMLGMILGAAVFTAWIIARMHRQMTPVADREALGWHYQAEAVGPPTLVDSLPSGTSQRAAINPPQEIHNHLHLDGLDPEDVAKILASMKRDIL